MCCSFEISASKLVLLQSVLLAQNVITAVLRPSLLPMCANGHNKKGNLSERQTFLSLTV